MNEPINFYSEQWEEFLESLINSFSLQSANIIGAEMVNRGGLPHGWPWVNLKDVPSPVIEIMKSVMEFRKIHGEEHE